MKLNPAQKRMILNARAYLMHVARAAQQGADEPLCNALQQCAADIFTVVNAHERAQYLAFAEQQDNTLYFPDDPGGRPGL